MLNETIIMIFELFRVCSVKEGTTTNLFVVILYKRQQYRVNHTQSYKETKKITMKFPMLMFLV